MTVCRRGPSAGREQRLGALLGVASTGVAVALALGGCSSDAALGAGVGTGAGTTTATPTGTTTSSAPVTRTPTTEPPQPAPSVTRAAAGEAIPGNGAGPGSRPVVDPATRPVRLQIPSIGVDSSLVELGIAPDGSIEVPTDWRRAGWLDTSSVPGRQGPAVIAGHVDSKSGPAVFARLSSLPVGAVITVTRADGGTARFTVDGVQTYAKSQFPTNATYGPVPGPALRLITCGGSYVKSAGGYQSNVVVFAS